MTPLGWCSNLCHHFRSIIDDFGGIIYNCNIFMPREKMEKENKAPKVGNIVNKTQVKI
jgi:hypothetical protein